MAAKRQSNKGKSKSSAKPSYTPLLDAENLADAAPSGSSYNADLLTAGFNTLAKLREELWPGVADEMPLGIGAGGQQAAFDANQCKASLFGKDDASTVKYRCAQSIFRFDTLFNADPSVPLRQASINDLGKRFYELPAPYNGTLTIAVPPDWLEQSCDVLKAKPVSPCENILAFVLSIYRDIDDEEKLAQWRQHALSVNVEYVIANSDEQIYFLNTNLRQDLVAKKDALTHTTLQKIFSVLNCKSRMEKISGPLSCLSKQCSILGMEEILHQLGTIRYQRNSVNNGMLIG
ncbi:unnamed protein product [Cladocopium goreaui]|uniref:Uncharacterized protein n=1 Tax=Cladocopium goreaui TaxID=2562237 RepID=A0A9P1D2Z8_9DINO|nr:unnamed protein product [Cladocopium goreaui]